MAPPHIGSGSSSSIAKAPAALQRAETAHAAATQERAKGQAALRRMQPLRVSRESCAVQDDPDLSPRKRDLLAFRDSFDVVRARLTPFRFLQTAALAFSAAQNGLG